jgi:hypothetical protein
MDAFDRTLVRRAAAFCGAVGAAAVLLATASGSWQTGVVLTAYLGVFLLPFILLDALVIRPAMRGRSWPAVVGLELVALSVWSVVVQWRLLVYAPRDRLLTEGGGSLLVAVMFLLAYLAIESLLVRDSDDARPHGSHGNA